MQEKSSTSKTNNTQLLHRIGAGDEAAFARFFYLYYDKLYGFLLKITRSKAKAEDITQDVFLKIWQNRDEIYDFENAYALLFKMAQNSAIDELRRQAKEVLIPAIQPDIAVKNSQQHSDNPLELMVQVELQEILDEAVEKLPVQQKKVYTLYKIEGIRQDEIARQLNLSVSTIQSHMKLAMSNIQKYIHLRYHDLLILLIITTTNM
ncbi:MAG: polymerase, sigma-24 subunit, subfamily [Bacteroidetes bacterium]|jgi:RNA polymerase sigma-70 factor (ECF subfamily)|nr:polymerase, sigma-24 subunit, subfamily [Bacteroidota bacterium]